MKTFCIMIFIIASTQTWAEYRVYQYYIKSAFLNNEDQKAYITTSTLDPVSYQVYHGGSEVIKTDLIRTWMCKGNTGHKKEICTPPGSIVRDLASDLNASNNKQERGQNEN